MPAVSMEVAQFELGKLRVVDSALMVQWYDEDLLNDWIFADDDIVIGKNYWATKDAMAKDLRWMFKKKNIEKIKDYPFKYILDSGIRGDDVYKILKPVAFREDHKEIALWYMQAVARGIEAYAMGCKISEVPLVHPMLGVTYDGRKHSAWKLRKRYWVRAYKMQDKWHYIVSDGKNFDLISIF